MPLSVPINCYQVHSYEVRVVASLSNALRWNIVRVLYLYGPQTQAALATYLQSPASTLSRHLRILADSHIVQCHKQGRSNLVALAPTAHSIVMASLPLS